MQFSIAQVDSINKHIETLKDIPASYIKNIENKIDKYSRRITGKTGKTLEKLAKWETKIKGILDKFSPETSQKLFGNNQTTFSTLLQKYKEGMDIATKARASYDAYRDKLVTSIKYLESQKENIQNKLLEPVIVTGKKLKELDDDINNSEAVELFIKERKKQLVNEAVKYIGNSKYLAKIDKESYYYIETIRNYKELFTDKKKAEDLAMKILKKIPAYSKFIQENSMLASLFGVHSMNGSVANLAGLQTRTSINSLIQERLSMGGPNAREAFSQSMQQAQAELKQLKDKVIKAGSSNSDANIPDFKPNSQKSKTFLQRLEYSSNIQFAKNNSYVPTTTDIALTIGYKLNDKSVIGVGASYKMGLGRIDHIRITHEGIGLRSFIDWKIKKQFFVSGGFEMNYNTQFKNVSQLKFYNQWQQAGLLGLTKKINIKTKLFKATSLQLLYDFLYRQHLPVSQPVVFRTGYTFN